MSTEMIDNAKKSQSQTSYHMKIPANISYGRVMFFAVLSYREFRITDDLRPLVYFWKSFNPRKKDLPPLNTYAEWPLGINYLLLFLI